MIHNSPKIQWVYDGVTKVSVTVDDGKYIFSI